jgi:hypothetical protein
MFSMRTVYWRMTPNTEAVEWFLLTTIEIGSADEAEQCLRWYCLRWRIEDRHRVLKSGCRIEAMTHDTADRLRRVIATDLVIAWRIMRMTLLGREVTDLPAEVLFSDVELRTLHTHARKTTEASHVAVRCCAHGGEDRRIPRPPQRSASRPSTDVAGLCGVPVHVLWGLRCGTIKNVQIQLWVQGRPGLRQWFNWALARDARILMTPDVTGV